MSLLVASLLLFAAAPAAAQWTFPVGPAARSGSVRVECHVPCPEDAVERAAALADAAWRAAGDFYPLRAEPAEVPTVHILAEDDYERVSRDLNGPDYENLAFSDVQSRTAFVQLQPRVTETVMERVGLPAQTLRLVAHEVVHLRSYHWADQAGSLPAWYSEGVASTVEIETGGRLGVLGPGFEDPYTSTLLWRAQRLMEEDELPRVAEVMTETRRGISETRDYAVRSLLVRYLRDTRPDDLRALARRIPRLDASGSDFRHRMAEEVRRRFGRGFDELDDGFRTWLRGRRPVWIEVRRSLETAGAEWVHLAFPSGRAIALANEPPRPTYTVSGEVEVLADDPAAGGSRGVGASEAAVVVGWGGGDHLAVVFRPGSAVRVERRAGRDEPGQVVARGGVEWPVTGFARFDVRVDGSRLTVDVDGRRALDREVEGLSVEDRWGLEVAAEGVAVWRLVEMSGGPPIRFRRLSVDAHDGS